MISAASSTAVLYGLIQGFTYDGVSELEDDEESNCFFAAYGLIDSVDMLVFDVKHILSDSQLLWVNTLLYDPTHIFGDILVNYE